MPFWLPQYYEIQEWQQSVHWHWEVPGLVAVSRPDKKFLNPLRLRKTFDFQLQMLTSISYSI